MADYGKKSSEVCSARSPAPAIRVAPGYLQWVRSRGAVRYVFATARYALRDRDDCAACWVPMSLMKEVSMLSAEEALERLKRGNHDFVTVRAHERDLSSERIEELYAYGQNPFAVVVSCADSRTVPEHMFMGGCCGQKPSSRPSIPRRHSAIEAVGIGADIKLSGDGSVAIGNGATALNDAVRLIIPNC